MRKLRFAFALAICCLGVPVHAAAQIQVHDGDTFTLNGEKIRLWGIDAPELLQPLGFKCRDDLQKILAPPHKLGEIKRKGKSYQRTVAEVWMEYAVMLNALVVSNGCAMVDPRYARNSQSLNSAQLEAQTQARGIWAEEDPEPPWEYRRRIKNKK